MDSPDHSRCPLCGGSVSGSLPEPSDVAEFFAGKPDPRELYEQTGGGDAYRVAMLEHGLSYPTAPWQRKSPGKTTLPCGLVHEFNWSPWKEFSDDGRRYEARWCLTCATTQAREVPDA